MFPSLITKTRWPLTQRPPIPQRSPQPTKSSPRPPNPPPPLRRHRRSTGEDRPGGLPRAPQAPREGRYTRTTLPHLRLGRRHGPRLFVSSGRQRCADRGLFRPVGLAKKHPPPSVRAGERASAGREAPYDGMGGPRVLAARRWRWPPTESRSLGHKLSRCEVPLCLRQGAQGRGNDVTRCHGRERRQAGHARKKGAASGAPGATAAAEVGA